MTPTPLLHDRHTNGNPDAPSWIQGTSQMAGLIRTFDWSATGLGPISSWTDTLRNAVNLILSAPVPMQLLWGPELFVIYNDALKPFLTDKHPSALGQPAHLCWKEAWETIGPQLERVLRTGEAVQFQDVLVPIERHGTLEDVYWDYCYTAVFGPDGTVEGVLDIAQDTTAAVLAGRQRDAANAQLSQLLAGTSDAVVGMSREWEITYVNQVAITTYGVGRELVGRNFWKEFPEAAHEGSPFLEHYHRAMFEGIPGSFETHYPDPLNIWLRLEVYPTAEGIVTFSRDVTERRRATEALLQTEKLAAVGRLAASIAHEINNPLESVTNLLYLARSAEALPEVREYLDLAERELRRVSVITSQTLRFYKQSTSPTLISCEDLFQEVLSIYQGRLVNSHIQVETRKRARRPTECFEGEIRQVLNNLIGNAIDAMHPSGGRLLVRSREGTNWSTDRKGLVLTVADTGTGIAPATVKKIFDAFYTTKGIGGTGLGLWLSKEIMDRHHGALRVRSSQREGASGTVFTLFLPFEAVSRP